MKRKLSDGGFQNAQEVKKSSVSGSVLLSHGGDGVLWTRREMIGKGSFGSVYLATLKKPRSRYGCFPAAMAVKSAEVSVSGSLQKEKEALNNIGWSPNIITCFGEEITNGINGEMVYNLLLEYGSGGTLAELIKKSDGQGLPESDVRYYTRSILRGLNHIHEKGYVHCDLKPENILLVNNNTNGGSTNSNTNTNAIPKFKLKIGDFGLAKRAAKQDSKKRKLELDPYWRGTPTYLSPEVVAENVQEAPSDVWALGCIVLEMLTGKPAWDGKQDLDADELVALIGEGYEAPKVPDTISKEGKGFLKGCFSRKAMFRLTSQMLLDHSFLEGLADDEDDGDDEVEGNEKILLMGSTLVMYETDEEDYVYSSYSEDNDDDICLSDDDLSCSSSWSEYPEEGEEFSSSAPEEVSGIEERGGSMNSNGGSVLGKVTSKQEQVTKNTMQQCSIPFSIPAGV